MPLLHGEALDIHKKWIPRNRFSSTFSLSRSHFTYILRWFQSIENVWFQYIEIRFIGSKPVIAHKSLPCTFAVPNISTLRFKFRLKLFMKQLISCASKARLAYYSKYFVIKDSQQEFKIKGQHCGNTIFTRNFRHWIRIQIRCTPKNATPKSKLYTQNL